MGQIVVGYDGSDCSKAALEEAVGLAKSFGDEVVLVFGYAPPGIWGGEIAEHEEAIAEFGERVMADGKRLAEADGVEARVALVPKRGPEALVDVAKERAARMIVVGSQGEAPLKGVIVGSTPYKLLHFSPCPVLVVPAS
ncbi:MAG TPA: universal stress protein [Solirubrobacterales bacterium]|nr:universal stress protein [Solirubrobacterales bacterium]